jgi:hypothetical protein
LKLYGDFLAQLDHIRQTVSAVQEAILVNNVVAEGRKTYELMKEHSDDFNEKIDQVKTIAFQASLISGEAMTNVLTETVQGLRSLQFGYNVTIAAQSSTRDYFNFDNASNWLMKTVTGLPLVMKDELGLLAPAPVSKADDSTT